ncbi:MAG: hypothetical protein NTV86_14585, partial [Planctomycetota bacterium]|nr:hypothetical protein [Planctomycetota bacterium]
MRYVAIAALAAILVLPLALGAEPGTPATMPASPKAPAPTTEIAAGGCVTGDCHAGVKKHRVVHGP